MPTLAKIAVVVVAVIVTAVIVILVLVAFYDLCWICNTQSTEQIA